MARAPSFSASAISAATRAREAGSLVRASGETAANACLAAAMLPASTHCSALEQLVIVAVAPAARLRAPRTPAPHRHACLRRQVLRALLVCRRGLLRLHQAAGGRQSAIPRAPRSRRSRGRREITAIPCIPVLKLGADYSDKRDRRVGSTSWRHRSAISAISSRARATRCRACALIAAEDTRHTGALLKHFGIQTPQVSLHDHNEQQRAPELIERMRQGAAMALVSDAGTPGHQRSRF